MGKKKENGRVQNQKEAEKKITQKKRVATLVKKTKSRVVTRTNLKNEKPLDKTQEHSTPESVRKIVPITNETAKALQRWAGDVGEVGVTSITPAQELTIVVFGRDSSSGTLITYNAQGEEVYGLIPYNKGHKPRVGIKYLCRRPRLDWEPLFYIRDRPVYSVKVFPLIIKQINEKVVSLTLDDPGAVITEELLSHAAFEEDTILYIENNECKYVWVKNPAHIGKVETVLSETEKMEQGGMSNPWQKEGRNLLKAPVYAISPENAARLVAQAIQQKEEKLLSKNELLN